MQQSTGNNATINWKMQQQQWQDKQQSTGCSETMQLASKAAKVVVVASVLWHSGDCTDKWWEDKLQSTTKQSTGNMQQINQKCNNAVHQHCSTVEMAPTTDDKWREDNNLPETMQQSTGNNAKDAAREVGIVASAPQHSRDNANNRPIMKRRQQWTGSNATIYQKQRNDTAREVIIVASASRRSGDGINNRRQRKENTIINRKSMQHSDGNNATRDAAIHQHRGTAEMPPNRGNKGWVNNNQPENKGTMQLAKWAL